MTSLRNIVDVRRRFLRSVNIARDQKQVQGLEGYVITPLVQRTLMQIADSFNNNVADRAFTLTGPYGTGKSSFGLLLYHLLQWPGDEAWRQLREVNTPLAKKLHKEVFGAKGESPGYIVLPVTSRLADALDEIQEGLKNKVSKQIESLRSCNDSKTAVRLVEEIVAVAVSDGYRGIFFIFDEFGKVFEEAYFNKRNTDIFLLQDLAETASRSGDKPILFLGMLHQNFGNYVDDIHDIKTKNEFGKIEGRFQSLSFVETPAAQLQLLSGAIVHKRVLPTSAASERDARIEKGVELQLHMVSGLSIDDFREYALQAWPIQPLAMLALPLLFRRFGQNERSVFTFLSSNEPHGFQSFINNNETGNWLCLEDLFDYLLINYETRLSHHPQGKIFLEANDILNSKNLADAEQRLIKVVAVLSSLGRQSNLKASSALIQYAMGGSCPDISKLQMQSILVYRKFSDSYCVWEGSDVDLIECAAKADRALGQSGFSIAHPLQIALPPRPVIAKRHSFRSGALRYFAVDYVDSPDDLDRVVANRKHIGNASGRILICFAGSDATIETFIKMGKERSAKDKSLLFAIPENIDELRAALYEVQRLKWIVDNTEELRDDRIAQREIELRQAEANQKVAQLRISLTDPRPAPMGCSCSWVWAGETQNLADGKAVSVLLSHDCDEVYADSPAVLNDINIKRNI